MHPGAVGRLAAGEGEDGRVLPGGGIVGEQDEGMDLQAVAGQAIDLALEEGAGDARIQRLDHPDPQPVGGPALFTQRRSGHQTRSPSVVLKQANAP